MIANFNFSIIIHLTYLIMKTKLLLPALMLFVLTFMSCGSDSEDPAPPHEVGTWKLSQYALKNVPAAYNYNEGVTFALNEVNLGISSYELILNQNLSYSRTLSSSGSLPQDDAGIYTITEAELTLNSDNDDQDEVFDVQKNTSDDLWLSLPLQFGLIKNTVIDTLTAEYYNSLTADEQDALFDPVNVDFVLVFDRAQ